MAAPDTAGVAAPPPLIFAAAFVGGWLLGHVFPWPILPDAVASRVAFVPGLAALALAVAALREMRRARTAVSPYTPTTVDVPFGIPGVERRAGGERHGSLVVRPVLGLVLVGKRPCCTITRLPAARAMLAGLPLVPSHTSSVPALMSVPMPLMVAFSSWMPGVVAARP